MHLFEAELEDALYGDILYNRSANHSGSHLANNSAAIDHSAVISGRA